MITKRTQNDYIAQRIIKQKNFVVLVQIMFKRSERI